MSEIVIEVGHCHKCGSQRADVLTEHIDDYDDGYFQAYTRYKILECRGCGQNYYKTSSTNSEDYTQVGDDKPGEWETVYNETIHYWPPPAKHQMPEWASNLVVLDRIMGALFADVYTALSNNLGVLAAIGMRTVFDRASELLGVDEAKPFNAKLADLQAKGHISMKQGGVLAALIDAGSAAAHRGWQPKPHQLEGMLVILEAFLHTAFLLADVGDELVKHVPKKKPRAKSNST